MGWRRTAVTIAIAAAVVLAIVWGFMPRPVLVDAEEVVRGPLEVTVREEGKTRVVERYTLAAPVPAYARRVELDVGDPVQEGEVLVRLEPLRSQVLDARARAEAAARVDAAAAALEARREEVAAAEADATLAEAELERFRELHARGAISTNELDQAESASRRARARLEAARRGVDVARNELEVARAALRYSAAEDGAAAAETVPVRAPVSGNVLAVLRESEGAVGMGEPLLEVGNPDLLEVEVEVLSSDAIEIEPGTRVRLERWGGPVSLDAVVRTIEPVGFTKISALGVEEQRVPVIADLVSPPTEWRRLGDGYRVEAVFILWEGADVLQVPTSSLFRHGDGWAVFVVTGGTARLTPVEVGHRAGLRAEVLSGLSAGDRVIVHPPDDIADGTAVRLRDGGGS